MFFSACTTRTDVVVIGGGASGCTASIAAARGGVQVILAEEQVWLGGMLTSAGVSAVDGNYNMRAGIFEEFEERLAEHYGGWSALQTAWVSNVMFEPHVGEHILEDMVAAEPNIELHRQTAFVTAEKLRKGWKVTLRNLADSSTWSIVCKVLIDCTELGDLAKAAGVSYHIGFDAKSRTGESIALEEPVDIVQDLTIVATLKDYGPDADMTIPKPDGYDESRYVNCCYNEHNMPADEPHSAKHTLEQMMTYGALQGGKTMINWPVCGNDFYINLIEMTPEERETALAEARNNTLGFVYFIQTALGLKNWGLADDEFPSEDGLALIPYHRESRRIDGEASYVLDAMERPYDFSFYRAGVAVGDYPVDHHHYACPDWQKLQDLHFYPVPSFCVPAGVIVPLGVEDLLVAEKSVSVSNLAAGATRLQPVVSQLGQVAGTVAAIAVRSGVAVRDVSVRDVQTQLLADGMYLQPFVDLPKSDPDFAVLQRIGSTGIMRGDGEPYQWANRTWFRPSDPALVSDIYLDAYYGIPHSDDSTPLTYARLMSLLHAASSTSSVPSSESGQSPEATLTRLEAARIIDASLHPFETVPVDWSGHVL